MARKSKRLHLISPKLDLCQISAGSKYFLWCYSQNSRSLPKKGKKRTEISIPTPQLLGKRISHSDLQYIGHTVTQYQPVPGSICSVITKMVGLDPKQEKSALKCPSKYLNYSQSAHIALYDITRATCIPIFGQVNMVSVVLSIKMSSYTQNPKKAHLQYWSIHLNLCQGSCIDIWASAKRVFMENIVWFHEVSVVLFIKKWENGDFGIPIQTYTPVPAWLSPSKNQEKYVLTTGSDLVIHHPWYLTQKILQGLRLESVQL